VVVGRNCKALPVGTLSVADVQFQGKGGSEDCFDCVGV
jgi:hypothetical protein